MYKGKLVIAVGSTSKHKLEAVKDAVRELDLDAIILGVNAESGVNEQPKDLIETRRGASTRAAKAYQCSVGANVDFAIGIESGIMPTVDANRYEKPQQYIDCAIVCLVSLLDEEIVSMAPGHMVNTKDVYEAERRGLDKHTVSSVTRERTNCDATDSCPHYTGGKVHRRECLAFAVKIVIAEYLEHMHGTKLW